MIIGVTGDTHNNLKNIKRICSIFNENRADLVFHTGDITLPKSLMTFQELNSPLKVILGNNDIEERSGLQEISNRFDCKIFEEPFSMEVNDINISVLHHPELITEEMMKSNDLILHGHTHRYRLEKKFNCIIFNPGECAGFMEGKNQVGLINLNNLNTKIINF